MTAKDYFKVQVKENGVDAFKMWKHLNISYEDIVSIYEELGLECPIMIRESKIDFFNRGWGNGYVLIPEGHDFHGKPYHDIDVSVHGGLTFAEHIPEGDDFGWRPGYWIGFDTAHAGDDKTFWTKLEVLKETINLLLQVYK
jgi:hypothetical protein